MVPPADSSPDFSAASIILTAMRSLTEPPGLKYSTFASTSAGVSDVTECSRTSGVFPIRETSESWTSTRTSLERSLEWGLPFPKELSMPEAVVVATARSPIGRAFKGSLIDLRPDDLVATIIQTALDKVPQLDPHSVEDLLLGCGLPGGEQGFNMARVVAVKLGLDDVPGTTLTRYCSSSLQTTRMAFHAIKAGEGDVFISAGVEMVSRFAKGNSDSWPDTQNPFFAEAQARTAKAAEGGQEWHDPRADGKVPDIYIAMGETAENLAGLKNVSREEMDEFGARSQNMAEKAIANGFWEREITPVTLPDGRVISGDDGPRAGVTVEAMAGLKPVFRPDGKITAGNACPLNDGAAAVIIMSGTKAKELGITPLARIVSTGVTGLSPEIMGY